MKIPVKKTTCAVMAGAILVSMTGCSQIEDMIAPAYSDTDTYPAYSLVIVQHKLYYNPQAIEAAEDWTPAHWEEITLAEIFEGNLQGG